ISLKTGDTYADAAELAATQPGSPAYKAGLRKGDTIVQIDSEKIARQSQLKHALGPRYAGETVNVIYIRGKERERREAKIELTDKLIPYEHPFLGLLPFRDESDAVRVRYVFPGGPAAKAGVKAGDRIVALNASPAKNADELRTLVANLEPKAKAALKVER